MGIPLGFKATAQADGLVTLEWLPVQGAVAYQLYRLAPTETEWQVLQRTTALSLNDQTHSDGDYQYTVVSVRQENQQEALSIHSDIVQVSVDRSAPSAPYDLRLSANGAGVVARWTSGGTSQP